MSSQEVRNGIIHDNLPELIKSLTGFNDEEDVVNIRRCENFAFSFLANHRNLSTNSHEVRRKIEGIQEKFNVDNNAEYAQHLKAMCDVLVSHPLCKEHYEVDVAWSLLDFLLTLTHNPTGALRRNKQNIDALMQLVQMCSHDDEHSVEQDDAEYWRTVLREDFIPTNYAGSESDLSNWSSDEDNNEQQQNVDVVVNGNKSFHENELEHSIHSGLFNLKPPEKENPFHHYEAFGCEQRLKQSVQHSWQKSDEIESQLMEGNFGALYNKFLSETTYQMIDCKQPLIASEECLIREILWMFHSPQNCRFFELNGDDICLKQSITICSVSENGLRTYLQQNFVPYMQMMQTLKAFISSIYICEDFTPSKTLECYAAALRLLLQPINEALLAYEKRLVLPQDFQINTVVHMQSHLQQHLQHLKCLYNIHQQSLLNPLQHAPHIYSAFLLSSLICCHQNSATVDEANYAISLFLAAIQIFCVIIDTWWTEGRLDDWQQEFLVERFDYNNTISVRPYYKDKHKAFFVPSNISNMIAKNSIFTLLLEHSLEAGCTLNLLYEINRIGDMRNACSAIEGKLYDVFIADVMNNVEKFQAKLSVKETSPLAAADVIDHGQQLAATKNATTTAESNCEILHNLSTKDDFLLLAFASNLDFQQDETDATTGDCTDGEQSSSSAKEYNALHILKQLEKSSNVILPLEEVVITSLTRILKTRIAFANSFVMQLYYNEFEILKHLRNIRKVLLLEASDLMHQFYDKLFKQIESGKHWSNPYLLNMQLDDILCSKYPEMSSMFRVEINSTLRCQTTKVYDAVDELIVGYNFNRELSYIITEDNISDYNKVFQFLLKVKWGIMTLESLKFPKSHKCRKPYAPFQMIDLVMRRLEQLRFWMMYAIQSIHFYLMTHVLHHLGERLDSEIASCKNLKEMQTVHSSYLSTVCRNCLLVTEFDAIKLGVQQVLNLALILRYEWNSCVRYIEQNNPLAIHLDDSMQSQLDETDAGEYIANSRIDDIELTYIRIHQYLANLLNNEVYLKQNSFLNGLNDAFNTSLPY